MEYYERCHFYWLHDGYCYFGNFGSPGQSVLSSDYSGETIKMFQPSLYGKYKLCLELNLLTALLISGNNNLMTVGNLQTLSRNSTLFRYILKIALIFWGHLTGNPDTYYLAHFHYLSTTAYTLAETLGHFFNNSSERFPNRFLKIRFLQECFSHMIEGYGLWISTLLF